MIASVSSARETSLVRSGMRQARGLIGMTGLASFAQLFDGYGYQNERGGSSMFFD